MKARPPAPPPRSAPGEVRLIGGRWKRTRLPVPAVPGLRPTPDRVRETLFNWLGQTLEGWRCVDAFAGSGALGLEAASRGAVEVLLIESDRRLVEALQAAVLRLQASGVSVRRGDALALMATLPAAQWDLVLLDPPFAEAGVPGGLFEAALQAAHRLLRPHGWLYLESPRAWDEAALNALGLTLWRQGRAGAVHHHLLQRLG